MCSALLDAFTDLRVADVRDAMDFLGRHGHGSMHHTIRPLWRTRAFGIARTARYVQYEGAVPECSPDEYLKWSAWYYGNVRMYPWMDEIREGDFMVIDVSGVDAGLMGSENTLACVRRGVKGFVTGGAGVRDTDEIIMQKVPFWTGFISQSMVQGRLAYDGRDIAVCVGGVTVHPGDMVVADGDGVIVVPQEIAVDVARLTHKEHERDKKSRRGHYEALGREPDATV